MTPHWHVLGAGAIGSLFATFMHRAGFAVTLVLRERLLEAQSPLIVETEKGCERLRLPLSAGSDEEKITHLLVTTKAYEVCAAIRSVAHRLDGDSQVVLMANGMGFVDELRRELPWLALYQATTTEGAYRIATRHIRHAGSGQTRIGQPGRAEPPKWFEHWSRVSDACLWDPDITQALWLKLAVNCAINPLTALHQCRNGQLLARPELGGELAGLCAEIARVTEAAGYTRLAANIEGAVREVIASTAQNQSSMLQDIKNRRPTEINYITGHLLRVAAIHGVDAPLNAQLLEKVRCLGD